MQATVGRLYRDKNKLNENLEVLIDNRVLSKNDVLLMYVDKGMGIKELGENLGCGYKKANKILDKFQIPKNQHEEMTPRRMRVLRYVAYHQGKYKESPLIKDIALKLGLSSRSVVYHIQKMHDFGFLKKKKHEREIIITRKGLEWCTHTELFNVSEKFEEEEEDDPNGVDISILEKHG